MPETATLMDTDGTLYEVVGFGVPKEGDAYVRWDEENGIAGPLLNVAMCDHDALATPRLLLRATPIKQTCEHPETRAETHTYCATPDGCGECLG